jgi:hypothetical protein
MRLCNTPYLRYPCMNIRTLPLRIYHRNKRQFTDGGRIIDLSALTPSSKYPSPFSDWSEGSYCSISFNSDRGGTRDTFPNLWFRTSRMGLGTGSKIRTAGLTSGKMTRYFGPGRKSWGTGFYFRELGQMCSFRQNDVSGVSRKLHLLEGHFFRVDLCGLVHGVDCNLTSNASNLF